MEVTNRDYKVALRSALEVLADVLPNVDEAALALTLKIGVVVKGDAESMLGAAIALGEVLDDLQAEKDGSAGSVYRDPEATSTARHPQVD